MKNTKKTSARISAETISEILTDAACFVGRGINDARTSMKVGRDILKRATIEESEETPGAFFVGYYAANWIDADAFLSAVISKAFVRGYVGTICATWGDFDEEPDGRRYVYSYIFTRTEDDPRPLQIVKKTKQEPTP